MDKLPLNQLKQLARPTGRSAFYNITIEEAVLVAETMQCMAKEIIETREKLEWYQEAERRQTKITYVQLMQMEKEWDEFLKKHPDVFDENGDYK